MSFATTRTAIAEALSTVTGVTGYPRRPNTLSAGDAYPLLDEITRGPGLFFAATWRVIVILGGDEFDAEARVDDLLPELAQALNPVAFVDSATPLAVKTNAGDLFAVQLIARSE